MKQLFLIRHAKSSWKDPSLTDFERPLNGRGKKDAPFMGELLSKKNSCPDLILSSPAERAKSTALIIAEKVGYSHEIIFDEDIYEASVNRLLSLVNKIDNKYTNVFIFGHNPSFTFLGEYLSGDIVGNLPTCGVLGISFEFDDWALVSSNTGALFQYDYPKKYQ